MGASGVAAHGLRSYGPMGSAATQHAGPSRTRNQTSVRPHCKANSQSLDHQRSSLFAILVFPFFFFLSVSFSKLMFLLYSCCLVSLVVPTCPLLMVVFSRGTSASGQAVPPACPHTGSIACWLSHVHSCNLCLPWQRQTERS